jgi:diguanylate cyclase (GGDEF)-like protein/PAS domain S-box-containing protein
MVQPTPGQARDIISLPGPAASLELGPTLERVEQTEREFRLKTAPDGSGTSFEIIVDATGSGPKFRWVIFAVRNVSQKPLSYILNTQRRGFSGSGLYSPKLGEKPLVNIRASHGSQPTIQENNGGQRIVITVNPSQTITYVAQVRGRWPASLALWEAAALEERNTKEAFIKGLLLGIAALIAIYISTLFIVRRKVIFPVAALFAWSGVAFLCGEFGFLPSTFGVTSVSDEKFRAVTEAVMCFSLFGFLYSFLDLRRSTPVVGYAVLAILPLALAVIGLAATMPALGTAVARIGILAAVLGGCVLVSRLARIGHLRAQVIVPFWLFITLWSLAAGAAAFGFLAHNLTLPGLIAGLAIVLLTLAITVTQFAFTANLMSDGVYEDSGRKALALAGSEQCVWDWHEERRKLFIGRELEVVLGLKSGHIRSGGPEAWLQLIHPEDRSIYSTAFAAAIEQGHGPFSVEFRLQRADGDYRWFILRGRAFPGDDNRAQRLIGALADISTLKTSEERLMQDAVHDPLTSLPNRILFQDRLEQVILRMALQDGVPLAVFVIDIDRFKSVNDGLGHAVGDSLLLEMSRRLKKLIGPQDTLARLGGAQFGVIALSASDAREITALAERIRRAMGAPIIISPREVYLTASIGVARFGEASKSASDLLKDAEIALHNAKRQGKDKIEFFRASMRDDRGVRVSLESDLRRALERREIEIAYQPIVRLADMKVAGFEALMRWKHPKLGLLAPSDFIEIAEETGLIVEIGRYVLEQATLQLGTWQRAFTPTDPVFVSINVSSRQLLTGSLADDLRFVLERAELVPGTLKLEITETLIMENPEQSAKILRRLKELGASLSIDDFGTGYSSLSYLQRFPFDTLKIDQSFIQTGGSGSTTTIIMESIIDLAEKLGMEVVAEGAESAHDVEILTEAGCDFAQGFYFGQPMSSKEALDHFAKRPAGLAAKAKETA